jgi:hypothetical protein
VLRGTLIAESLRLDQPLDTASLRVESVRRVGPLEGVAADQPAVWTFLEFTAEDEHGTALARSLAGAIDPVGHWYCDFRSETDTFVVFAGEVFRYPRGDADGRALAAGHARALGVPEAQIDWPE